MTTDVEPTPTLITTFQLAERLSVSVETIRRWRKAGRIVPYIILPGGYPRWAWPLEVDPD